MGVRSKFTTAAALLAIGVAAFYFPGGTGQGDSSLRMENAAAESSEPNRSSIHPQLPDQVAATQTVVGISRVVPVLFPRAAARLHFGEFSPLVLADVPVGRFQRQLAALPLDAQNRALTKLARSRVPVRDVASLSVDGGGRLYYECLVPSGEAMAASAKLPEVVREEVQAISVPITAVPLRHSRPGAENVIYLDFDGQDVTGTQWNWAQESFGRPAVDVYRAEAFSTDADRANFSDSEQAAILAIWERVAQDFRAFAVDVTTERPAVFTAQTLHVLITRSVDANGVAMPANETAAGAAYFDVFSEEDLALYSPAFVYADKLAGSANIAEVVSHEVGHSLGLSHDGTSTAEYYNGHGSGSTGWAPIMGAPYGRAFTHWSDGSYAGANNTQDDLAIIAAHLDLVADEAGDTVATATPLSVTNLQVAQKGVIGPGGDADRYRFESGAGTVALTLIPSDLSPNAIGRNLNIGVELLDEAGNQLHLLDQGVGPNVFIGTWVPGGRYQLRIFGIGYGDPLTVPPVGFTSYGSVGAYAILGSIIDNTPLAPSFGFTPGTSVTVSDGGTVTINVYPQGNPAPQIRWERLAAGATAWVPLEDGELYRNSATSALTLASVAYAMNGDQFRAVLSNPSGIANGTPTVLTVRPVLPGVVASLPRLARLPGQDAEFTVVATGTPPFTYEWTKGGVVIPGATGPSLSLSNVQVADASGYQVKITNRAGSVHFFGDLAVVTPPLITTQPRGGTRVLGSSISFGAGIATSGPTTIEWLLNGVLLPGATSTQLQLNAVQFDQAGDYQLRVTNLAGSVLSDTARLTVNPTPAPEIKLTVPTVQPGGSVTLTSIATGTGPFTYQWYRDAVAMPGATQSTLTLSNVGLDDLVDYFVAITNSAGTALSETTRLELAPPQTPPAHHWRDAREVDGVAYFLFPDPARIARYDLVTETWLSDWELPGAPVAFTFTADAIYVAYANSVIRYDRSLANPFTLFSTTSTVLTVGLIKEVLFVATTGSTSVETVFCILNRQTGVVIDQRSGSYNANSDYVFSSAAGTFLGRYNKDSSPRISGGILEADNRMLFNRYGPFEPRKHGRLFTLAQETLLADGSGFVRSANDLTTKGSLGSFLDDAVADGADGYFALRTGRLMRFDASFRQLGFKALGVRAERLWQRGEKLFCFVQPAGVGVRPPLLVVPRAEVVSEEPVAPAVNPQGLAVWSPKVEVDPDGTVYLFSRLHRNVLRWSAESESYLPSVGVSRASNYFAIAPQLGDFFFDGDPTQLRRSPLSGETAATPFAGVLGPIAGVQAAGRHVFFVSANDGGNSSRLHFVVDQGGILTGRSPSSSDTASPVWSWSEVARRMYFLPFGASPGRMSYEQIAEDGELSQAEDVSPSLSTYTDLIRPLEVSADGRFLITGGGVVLETVTSTVAKQLPALISAAAWSDRFLFTLRPSETGSILELWDRETWSLRGTVASEGSPLRLAMVRGDRLLMITSAQGVPRFQMREAAGLDLIDGGNSGAPPEIVAQSSDQTAEFGEQFFAWVTTRGGPLPDYQWQVRPAGSGEWTDLIDDGNITGSQTGRLLIKRSSGDLSGARFRVIVAGPGGATTSSPTGVAVQGLPAVIDVAGGPDHLTYLRADGTAWSMGDNTLRQLGSGSSYPWPNALVQTTTNVCAVFAGSYGSGYLKRDGSLWATSVAAPNYPGWQSSMTNFAQEISRDAIGFASGKAHQLFLHRDGTLWGQGSTQSGQLAYWTPLDSNLHKMAGGVSAIAAGPYSSFWITHEGVLWGTGRNDTGQLGVAAMQNIFTPVEIARNVRSVVGGENYTLFITNDGGLWGVGTHWLLGPLDPYVPAIPRVVRIADNVIQAAIGTDHYIVLKSDGSVWTAGSNYNGQLGDSTPDNRQGLVQVASDGLKVAAGSRYSVVLKSDGSLWGAGYLAGGLSSGKGNWQQLAAGLVLSTRQIPTVSASDATSATSVELEWSSVSGAVGYEIWRSPTADRATATLLLTTGPVARAYDTSTEPGTLYHYWSRARLLGGYSEFGLSDAGTRRAPALPVIVRQPADTATTGPLELSVAVSPNPEPTYLWQMKMPNSTVWTALPADVGYYGTTSESLRMLDFNASLSGTMYRCVVTNPVGQVISNPATVTRVNVPPAITAQPKDITAQVGTTQSLSFSLAWSAMSSTYQWLKDGAIIPGATGQRIAFDPLQPSDGGTYRARVSYAGGESLSDPATVTVLPSTAVAAVSAGSDYSLLVRADGSWLGFGANAFGQVGFNSAGSPAIVSVPKVNFSERPFSAVSAGMAHSLFLRDGELTAAGADDFGQSLGNLGASASGQIADVVAVSAGSAHSLVLKRDGTAWAFGDNRAGQLGNGSTTTSATPVQVMSGVRSIETGGATSFFIKDDGTLWAVGKNDDGQLGNFSWTSALTPVQIATDVSRVSAADHYTVFLKNDRTLWGMGLNSHGQLGSTDGAGSSDESPALIANDVVQVSAGAGHVMFIKSDGSLWGLGRNSDGQLGTGDQTDRSSPVKIAEGATLVSAGLTHTLFVDANGTPWGMGANASQQLGNATSGDRATSPVRLWLAESISLQAPTGLVASDGTVAAGVRLGWNAASSARAYEVWRSTTTDVATATLIATDVENPLYWDASAVPGLNYYYWVKSRSHSGASSAFSQRDTGYQSGVSGLPVITTQPVGRTVSVGSDVALSVTVNSATAVTYTWRKNGAPVSTQTSSYFQIANPATLESAGDYDVVVTNSVGSVVSGVAMVQVIKGQRSLSLSTISDRLFSSVPLPVSGTVYPTGSGSTYIVEVLSGPATVEGNALRFTGVGAVSVRATVPEDAEYERTISNRVSFNVAPARVDLSLEGLQAIYDGWSKPVTVGGVPGGIGVRITYNGELEPPSRVGTYTVVAQLDSSVYLGTQAGRLTIAPADQTIAFVPLPPFVGAGSTVALQATASSGLPVHFALVSGPGTLNGATLTLDAAGRVVVRALQLGDESHDPAPPVEQSIQVPLVYADWLRSHFTPTELLDALRSGPHVDPDGDGLSNLLEYALGFEPKTATTSGLPEVAATATEWTYTYTRPSDRSDVTYAVEFSPNLAAWTTSGVTHELVSTDAGTGTQTWRARCPLNSAVNAFFRLKVALP